MIRVRVPATSANLGPGFDCLGIALNIYNEFEAELSEADRLENVEARFDNPDNLFLKAYHKAGEAFGVNDHVHARFHCGIPVSRGLGSSAALSVGGLACWNLLHPGRMKTQDALNLITELEGHPDNGAPALLGGLTASLVSDSVISRKLDISPKWKYTLFIPDVEVSTEKARAILPDSYPRNIAASNGAHAILMTSALARGDLSLLKQAAKDQIHEPYRKTLIPHFDEVSRNAVNDTGGVFLISGSGSTCILISEKFLSASAEAEIRQLPEHWQIITAEPAFSGTEYKEETWHPIF